MQEGTLIVEFLTPLTLDIVSTNKEIIYKNTKQLHQFYMLNSFLKNQTYISIPNQNNDIGNIINKFEKLGDF